jgi:hypothetical protein
MLATSEPFYMPQSGGEVVRVEGSLQPWPRRHGWGHPDLVG